MLNEWALFDKTNVRFRKIVAITWMADMTAKADIVIRRLQLAARDTTIP
ncbi:hypothetical protein AAC691_08610 [Nguyenibacter vanlangensis]|uniref:Uncharacterized protein n=1 Tax=Nguyenibacter vanlangensis TaxID=1216886 RepID=A0ABZ3DCA0_9PROT